MTKKYILLSILLLLLTTCGGYDHEGTSGTGNIAFKIDWQGAPTQSPPLEKGGEGGFERTAPLDCIAASVSTVTATVKDSSDNSLTTGGPWNCSAGSGNIEKVPAGSNRKVVVEGKDSSGSVLYRGEQTGITVVNGQTSPTVTVTVTPYTPDSFATAYSLTSGITITEKISSSTDVDYYAINVTSAGTISISMTPPSSRDYDLQLYNPSQSIVASSEGGGGATESISYSATTTGTYYIKVYGFNGAYDATNTYSLTATRTTSGTTTTTGQTPSAPIGVSASAGNGQVAISWSSVSGATSYNIYWSTTSDIITHCNLCNKNANIVSTSYTHTGLTNGTTYYYVVTAVNSYGESSESSQVSAMPTAPTSWTMLKLPDTGQTTSYTTTFGEDHDYTINPPSYTDNGNGTITDNVTGLIWQKEDDNTTRTWADAVTYCDNLNLGGSTDWRLPAVEELMSIVNYGTSGPPINTTYFPNTNVSLYWSSSTSAGSSSLAWGVVFVNGYVSHYSKSDSDDVRCVRGGQ